MIGHVMGNITEHGWLVFRLFSLILCTSLFPVLKLWLNGARYTGNREIYCRPPHKEWVFSTNILMLSLVERPVLWKYFHEYFLKLTKISNFVEYVGEFLLWSYTITKNPVVHKTIPSQTYFENKNYCIW